MSHEAKVDHLVRELQGSERGRALVFVRTKRGADRLVKKLDREKVRAVAMHGNKSQSQRQKALAAFEKGTVDTLVATDVAARGIDVPDITHVINFDAPEDRDAYTHRVGRTGRAGDTGAGVSFVLGDQVHDMRKMARDLGLTDQTEAADGTPMAVPSNGWRRARPLAFAQRRRRWRWQQPQRQPQPQRWLQRRWRKAEGQVPGLVVRRPRAQPQAAPRPLGSGTAAAGEPPNEV